MPMAGGGITADHVDQLVAALGCDVIVAVGGAIQGHPDGAAAGGRAVRAAIDAAVARRREPAGAGEDLG
jgi:2,3-diketo-5-methylthiopentyl-1-phosphate enolase